jgi:hypothetical protein
MRWFFSILIGGLHHIAMGIKELLFGGGSGPSEGQIRRATKAITEAHGDPAGRYSAADRLIQWKTPDSLYSALLRFTIQVPSLTIDQTEKEELSQMLVRVGSPMVQPILKFLRLQTDIRWPCEVLRQVVNEQEYLRYLLDTLLELKDKHIRDEEHKARLIQMLPKPGGAPSREVVAQFLENDNDEVVIAAIEYLADDCSDEFREHLIRLLIEAEGRPRVQAWVSEVFEERGWSVRPHTAEVEPHLPQSFYLTSKGVVKRRSTAMLE